MAQRPRSSGSRSGSGRSSGGRREGPPARGGSRRPPPRGGGGGNSGLIAGVIAIVVLGGIGAVLVMKGRGKEEKKPVQPAASVPNAPPINSRPTGPTEKPKVPPTMPSVGVQEAVKATAPQLEEIATQAQALYEEAMAARGSGNEKLWQEKLAEARNIAGAGLDIYNEEIIAVIPPNADYDEEAATNYWVERGERWIERSGKAIRKIQEIMSKMKASARN